VCALLYTLPALPEVLHHPVVSNPGFCTSWSVANEAGTHENTKINAAKCFIIVSGVGQLPCRRFDACRAALGVECDTVDTIRHDLGTLRTPKCNKLTSFRGGKRRNRGRGSIEASLPLPVGNKASFFFEFLLILHMSSRMNLLHVFVRTVFYSVFS
jgi:hypothetical protein